MLDPSRLDRLRRLSGIMARDVLDEILEAPEILSTPHGPVLVAPLSPGLLRILRDDLPDVADCEDGGDGD